jgi:hypothetical protein
MRKCMQIALALAAPGLISAQVQPPTRRPSEEAGRRGVILEIPNCMGNKPAEGFDNKGAAAQAWDFVVHPLAVDEATRVPAVMEALVEAVRDGR